METVTIKWRLHNSVLMVQNPDEYMIMNFSPEQSQLKVTKSPNLTLRLCTLLENYQSFSIYSRLMVCKLKQFAAPQQVTAGIMYGL